MGCRDSAGSDFPPAVSDTLEFFCTHEGVCTLCNITFYFTPQFQCISCLYIPLSEVAGSSLCSVGSTATCFHSRETSQLGQFCLSRQNFLSRLTNTCGGGLEYSTVIYSIFIGLMSILCMFIYLLTFTLHGETMFSQQTTYSAIRGGTRVRERSSAS